MQHLRIGITGGIGVGKSTVCQIFKQLAIPVYNSDSRAKHLMVNNATVVEEIKKHFSWDAYKRNGDLNREYLAKVVFNNAKELSLLNSIVHPEVAKDYELWTAEHKDDAYSVKEAALLFESKSYLKLHKVIVVTCPIDIRIDRIVKRDGVKQDDILKRIQNQMTDRERLKHADYVVYNDGHHSLIEQTLKIHNDVLALQTQAALPFKTP